MGPYGLKAPVSICVTDNHSLYDAIMSTKQVTEKRLWLDISGIKELIQSKTIKKVLWSVTKAQFAEKALPRSSKNSKHLLFVNIVSIMLTGSIKIYMH